MLKPIRCFVDAPLKSIEESGQNLVGCNDNQAGEVKRSFDYSSIQTCKGFQPLPSKASPSSSTQLSFFIAPEKATASGFGTAKPSTAPTELIQPTVLVIEPVPAQLAIARHRFFIVARQGQAAWAYPIQFRKFEARWLLPRLASLDWELNDRGIPIDAAEIHLAVEQLMGGHLINYSGAAQPIGICATVEQLMRGAA